MNTASHSTEWVHGVRRKLRDILESLQRRTTDPEAISDAEERLRDLQPRNAALQEYLRYRLSDPSRE